MGPTDSPEESSDDFWKELMKLFTDLQAMVQAGLLVEVRIPGRPSRYALTELGEQLTGQVPTDELDEVEPDDPHHEFPLEWPEPCPACGAADGFDGGGRCVRCHIAWPPEM